MNVDTVNSIERNSGKFILTSGTLMAASALFILWTCLTPMTQPYVQESGTSRGGGEALGQPEVDVSTLVSKLADRRLIRPSQVVAAVKDNGSAAKLLAQLKLLGTTIQDGKPMAYVNVEKLGMQTIHVGDRVLEFRVESIDSRGVGLTLDGVAVTLK